MRLNPKIIPIALVSFTAGYFAGLKQLKGHYEFMMESKLDTAKAKFELLLESAKADGVAEYEAWLTENATDEETLREVAEALAEPYAGEPTKFITEGFEAAVEAQQTKPIDYSKIYPASNVRVLRTPMTSDTVDGPNVSVPFVIAVDVYMNNVSGFEQVQLTYYSDDVLANAADEVVDQRERELMVDGLLDRFGEMSNDENTVYIQSPWLRQDIEVVRHNGTYKSYVLGLGDDVP
jgi:hypothetical protein